MADNVDPDPPPPPPEEVAVTQPTTPIAEDAPPPRQGCMEKRTCLEKVLVILVILILIICLAFLAAFLVFYFFASPPEGTCLTDECVRSASRLKTYMDESVDPCNNFYEYACGGWLSEQVLEPDESRRDVGTIIQDSNNIKIKSILEEARSPDEPEYKNKVKNFYESCMDIEKQNQRGAEPLFEIMSEFEKFPALDKSWNETEFELEETVIKLAKYSILPLFSVSVSRDLKNQLSNRLYIGDNRFEFLPKNRFSEGRDSGAVMEYEKYLVENLILLGAKKKQAERDMKEVVNFEMELAGLQRSDVEKADYSSMYNEMTVAMMQTKYPWINWLEVLQGIATNPIGGGVYIGVEESLINTEPEFLKKLGTLLDNTDKRVVANYLMSRLIKFTGVLGSDFVTLLDQFNQATRGVEPSPRWERCTNEATKIFPEGMSRMYVDHFFSKDAKEYMLTMIDDLTGAFSDLLEENDWMLDETKEKAEKKLSKMSSKVGYPEEIMDDDFVNSKYKAIPAEKDKYAETIFTFKKQEIIENFKELREPEDKSKWSIHPIEVNAQYNILQNSIIFPAAFLQAPVYSPEFTSSMNYGGIGVVIGHEITHGFDNVGSQYDTNGELKTWWTEKDKDNFNSRSECFVDQYGCYKWDGNSINGKLTLGENIADNGGLKQSYKAYRNLVKRRGSEEARLPGLDLNHDQIFFLSFAQVWCGKYRDEVKKQMVQSDAHTPSPYRVYGTLQNSIDFAEAFQCPSGSRMNPLRKCVLW